MINEHKIALRELAEVMGKHEIVMSLFNEGVMISIDGFEAFATVCDDIDEESLNEATE